MDLLLIAPYNPSLPGLDAEIAAISSFHTVTALIGEKARQVDIADAISEHPEGFDCLWIASHGSDIGIQITGEILTADGLGQYITASRARLCVLNTCASEALARQIIVGTDCDLIFTIADVLDSDSLRFGTLLAGELAKTDNFRQAFDLASPRRGRYKYLAAKAAVRALDMTVSSELQKLGARVDEGVKSYMESSRLIYQMSVDAKSDRQSVDALRLQMTALQQQVDLLRQQSQTREMRDELRKEDRNLELAAMGRKIDASSTQAFTPTGPVIPTVSVDIVKPVSIVTPSFIAIVIVSILLLVVVFYLGRVL